MADGKTSEMTIEDAKGFCERMEAEKKLRDAITDIMAKLNRSNLSAEDGEKHAEALVNAYKALQRVNVYKLLKDLAK